MDAKLTITASDDNDSGGILVSLSCDGDYTSDLFAKLFYSIRETPPPDLDGLGFWAPIIGKIGGFLLTANRDDD